MRIHMIAIKILKNSSLAYVVRQKKTVHTIDCYSFKQIVAAPIILFDFVKLLTLLRSVGFKTTSE